MNNELKDKSGTIFDPEIHATRNGQPKLNKNGFFWKKNGRKKITKMKTQADNTPKINEKEILDSFFESSKATESVPDGAEKGASFIPETATTEEKPKTSCDFTAAMIVGMTESTLIMLLGQEMKMEDSERAGLCDSWEKYLEETGNIELPAWAGLAVSNFLYISNHLQNEKVREKLSNLWAKITGKNKEKDEPINI